MANSKEVSQAIATMIDNREWQYGHPDREYLYTYYGKGRNMFEKGERRDRKREEIRRKKIVGLL